MGPYALGLGEIVFVLNEVEVVSVFAEGHIFDFVVGQKGDVGGVACGCVVDPEIAIGFTVGVVEASSDVEFGGVGSPSDGF